MKDPDCRNGSHTEDATNGGPTTADILTNGQVSFHCMKSASATIRLIPQRGGCFNSDQTHIFLVSVFTLAGFNVVGNSEQGGRDPTGKVSSAADLSHQQSHPSVEQQAAECTRLCK